MKLREYAEQQLEALGLPPKLEFELDDGTTVELLHPWLWSDKTQAAVDKATTNTETVKAILGPREHKRLIDGGGSSNQILLAVETMKRRIQQATNGETGSDPKGS